MNSRQRKKLEMVSLANERLDEALRVQREAGLALWQMERSKDDLAEMLSGWEKDQQMLGEDQTRLEKSTGYLLTRSARQEEALHRLRERYRTLQKEQERLAESYQVLKKECTQHLFLLAVLSFSVFARFILDVLGAVGWR